MLQTQIKLTRYLGNHFREITAALADADLRRSPAPGLGTPLWMLGHIAITNDSALALLGEAGPCPSEWHLWFGPGSNPASVPEPGPTRADLVKMIELGHAQLIDAAGRATPESLSRKHTIPLESLENYLPTVGDAVSHVMTTHFALYLGQLTMALGVLGVRVPSE